MLAFVGMGQNRSFRVAQLSLFKPVSSPRLEKMCKRFQRDVRDVMLHSLGVGFGRLGGNAHGAQEVNHEPVPNAYSFGELVTLLG